jgi:acyl-CoA dehydrogenase
MRRVVNDAMDIQGGSGICLGPKNYLGRVYQVIPVSITVEGANILTRTMMIFGQGAVRCHPYIQQEMAAIAEGNLAAFDQVFFKHIGHWGHNKAACLWLGLTNARFLATPGDKETKRYYRQIARLSVGFAFLADYALLTLGGTLKRKERLSGRFADALSNLYLCSCVLKHYQNQGRKKEDLPLLHWACQESLYRAQQALADILTKLPFPPIASMLQALIFPLGKPNKPASDAIVHQTAALLLADSPVRDRLTKGIYINDIPDDATGRIEMAFKAVLTAAPIEAKIKLAQKQKQLAKGEISGLVTEAISKNIINKEEAQLLAIAENARLQAIMVDDFSAAEL